jgi:hypothetical protein
VIVGEPGDEKRRILQDEVLDLLVKRVALTRATLREALSVENERLGEALPSVEDVGRLRRRTLDGNASTDRLDERRSRPLLFSCLGTDRLFFQQAAAATGGKRRTLA